jgi:DNA repair exonuclease SbcCD ATPase subunit
MIDNQKIQATMAKQENGFLVTKESIRKQITELTESSTFLKGEVVTLKKELLESQAKVVECNHQKGQLGREHTRLERQGNDKIKELNKELEAKQTKEKKYKMLVLRQRQEMQKRKEVVESQETARDEKEQSMEAAIVKLKRKLRASMELSYDPQKIFSEKKELEQRLAETLTESEVKMRKVQERLSLAMQETESWENEMLQSRRRYDGKLCPVLVTICFAMYANLTKSVF